MSLIEQWYHSSQSHRIPELANFSRLIREARRGKGLTQRELAAMLGTDLITLSRVENALVQPEKELIEKLASVLQIDQEMQF